MRMPLTKWLLLGTMIVVWLVSIRNTDTAIGSSGEIGTALVANIQLAAENNTDPNGQICFHVTDVKNSSSVAKDVAKRLTHLSQGDNRGTSQQIWVRL